MRPILLTAACAHLPGWLTDIQLLGLHFSLAGFLNSYGYLAVFLFIAIENLGVPFPGESMLLAASVYAAQGCTLQEPFVILACILGSIIGSSIGFWVGGTGGRGLLRKLHVSDKHLAPAEAYFKRYGGATVFFGRFLAVLRAWASFLAGVNHMNTGRFVIYNSAGAIIWSVLFGMLGFLLGKNLNKLQQIVTQLGALGLIIIVVVVIALVIGLRRYLRNTRHAGETTSTAPAAGPGEPRNKT